ncbi:hypothetical protein KVT40_002001 [Elsinoe batatas]|uniref:Uncharacterized protein n=1 Tax=Elsinoe batatas TaxID=2601811 RepID=A0A8K0L709_9PEZI|nr:hypothetical protein KVT40_002001 [Elsinoe batatas]
MRHAFWYIPHPAGTCVDVRVEMRFLQADWSFQIQSLSGLSVQSAPITTRPWRLRKTGRVHIAFRHTKHLQKTLHPHPVSVDIDTVCRQ